MKTLNNNNLTQIDERNLRLAATVYDDISEVEFIAALEDNNTPEPSVETIEQLNKAFYAEINIAKATFEKAKTRKLIIKYFATAAVFLFVCIPFTVLTVYANREQFANFLIKNFDEYSIIKYDSNELALKPYGWQSEYYPTWVPEGFKYNEVKFSADRETLWYSNANGKNVSFSVVSANKQPEFNSESYTLQNINIARFDVQLFTSLDFTRRNIIIIKDDKAIIISGYISEEDIVKMATNINFL